MAVLFQVIGPRCAYVITDMAARLIYRLLDPLRERCEAQCRAALAKHVPPNDIAGIAERSFVHRTRNLTDLLLAPRWLRPSTFLRFGGLIPATCYAELLAARRRGQPVIFVTAYYGAFDMLPIILGYQGIHPTVVYLPHANTGFDAFRKRVRSQGGCRMMLVDEAASGLGPVLEQGGSVAIVADHHVKERGMPQTFLGIQTHVMRSVGLLAWRYEADVVVAGLKRVEDRFRFEVIVSDVIKHAATVEHEDPVEFITDRYLRALERIVLSDPAQYFWAYARWGEAFAQHAMVGEPRDDGTQSASG
ncbi:MAG: lysophospholipid acyltransferase family protein [Planctomycetota bacterium]